MRRFIKTGIVFLFAGLAVGAWVLVRRELFGIFPHPHLVSAHTHAVQVGFILFLILGVAIWLFPRAAKDDTRYSPERIEASYWILTISTAARWEATFARRRARSSEVLRTRHQPTSAFAPSRLPTPDAPP